MICRFCIRAATRAQALTAHATLPTRSRFLSSSTSALNAAATAPTSQAASSSAAPPPPSSKPTDASAKPAAQAAPAKPKHPLIKSSVPAGTPLKGLNFIKGAADPVALEDHEYPSWLWEILSSKEAKGGVDAKAGDLFSKSKKQRRIAAKRLRAEQLQNPDAFAKKVPIYEQTVDLPAGDGTLEGNVKAAEARGELTKALRDKRRAGIKEKNFLKAMR